MTDVTDDPFDAGSTPADELTYAAASFLAQVLELEDDPATLVEDLAAIKRDQNAAIHTIQLESSVGPAAFLVYTYVLDVRGGDGHTGRELYEAGLETLQQAAIRNTPGPRAVAHADTDRFGFILATTPGTYRALTGQVATPPEPAPEELPATGETERVRSEAAEEMLRLLQEANSHARSWIAAIRSAGASQGDADDVDDLVAFTEAETELALFLLDEESIGDLLRALNMLVSAAQQQTAEALGQDEPDATWPTEEH